MKTVGSLLKEASRKVIMKNWLYLVVIALCAGIPIALLAVGIYIQLSPDVVTPIVVPAVAETVRYEHSRPDSLGFILAGLITVVGAVIALFVLVDEINNHS